MKILVLSDTHGNIKSIISLLIKHADIKDVFFLGDNTNDIDAVKEQFSDRVFHCVSGNCDFSSPYKSSDIASVNGTRIFFTHGHKYGVKYTLENLKATARENNCALALFGHTHCSLSAYDDGLYIVNPGSPSFPRDSFPSYAVIDITDKGIMPNIMRFTK
ncbi:MAG: metallophosphoesterase [Ruminococcaceae bacterium]|nr:metallophosphoesterase [Oscillospiraceae bacterium]